MTATRFDWQQHLASIYAASMDQTSGDSLVHTVYAYMIGKPKGLSPFVTVSAGGSVPMTLCQSVAIKRCVAMPTPKRAKRCGQKG